MAKTKSDSAALIRSRRRKRKVLLFFEIVFFLLLIVGAYVFSRAGLIKYKDIKTEKNEVSEHVQEAMSGYTNIALFGVDNRTVGNYETGNSDAILIASINNGTKEVRLVSIYRDTYLDVNGQLLLRKCNYAYNHGGVTAAVNMLNRNLDLEINDYATVDFYALADAVDAVGGIDVNIDSKMMAQEINDLQVEIFEVTGKRANDLGVGEQHVNGAQALAYARVRHLEGGDYARAMRQREVVSKMIAKAKTMNVAQLDHLITSVFPHIDTSLSVTDMISMATAMKEYNLVDTSSFPKDFATRNIANGIGWVEIPTTLEVNVKKLHEYLFQDQDYTPSATVSKISKQISKVTGTTEKSTQSQDNMY